MCDTAVCAHTCVHVCVHGMCGSRPQRWGAHRPRRRALPSHPTLWPGLLKAGDSSCPPHVGRPWCDRGWALLSSAMPPFGAPNPNPSPSEVCSQHALPARALVWTRATSGVLGGQVGQLVRVLGRQLPSWGSRPEVSSPAGGFLRDTELPWDSIWRESKAFKADVGLGPYYWVWGSFPIPQSCFSVPHMVLWLLPRFGPVPPFLLQPPGAPEGAGAAYGFLSPWTCHFPSLACPGQLPLGPWELAWVRPGPASPQAGGQGCLGLPSGCTPHHFQDTLASLWLFARTPCFSLLPAELEVKILKFPCICFSKSK